jgi:hypothetical protein
LRRRVVDAPSTLNQVEQITGCSAGQSMFNECSQDEGQHDGHDEVLLFLERLQIG